MKLFIVLLAILAISAAYDYDACLLEDECGDSFAAGLTCDNDIYKRTIGQEFYWETFQSGSLPEGWTTSNKSDHEDSDCNEYNWNGWKLSDWHKAGGDRDQYFPENSCANALVIDGDEFSCDTDIWKKYTLHSSVTTAEIAISGPANSLFTVFSHAWKQAENSQSLILEVSYDGGAFQELLTWGNNDVSEAKYSDLTIPLKNPAGAQSLQLRFTYYSENAWFFVLGKLGVFSYPCIAGYEQDGNKVVCRELQCYPGTYKANNACHDCKPECNTCSDGNSCDTCLQSNIRSPPNCLCPAGHIDERGSCVKVSLCKTVSFKQLVDDECLHCSVYCKTCAGDLFINENPDQDLGASCSKHCQPCTVQESDEVCNHCPLKCQGCETECSTCADSTRTAPDCICDNGYWDEGGLICHTCRKECELCTGPKDCTKCLDPTRKTPGCYCEGATYDNEGVCEPCDPLCATCERAGSCTKCKDTELRKLPNCDCKDGYYQNEAGKCVPCSPKCKTCSDAETCTECTDPSRSLPGCLCTGSTYDNEGKSCEPCKIECETCTDAGSCTSCKDPSPNRADIPTCACDNPYYDNHGEECKPCNYRCKECNGPEKCTACKDPSRSLDECKCPPHQWDNNGEYCEDCPIVCETCSNAETCLTCLDKTRDAPHCKCYKGFYDVDNQGQECKKCDDNCAECTKSGECTVCKEDTRKLPYCECREGWFDKGGVCTRKEECSKVEFHNFHDKGDEDSQCIECDISCKTCPENHSEKCSPDCSGVCDQAALDADPRCELLGCEVNCHPCGQEEFCTDCKVQCASCKNTEDCLTCKDESRTLPNCLCQDGKYDPNGDGLTCQACHDSCATCEAAGVCLTCPEGSVKREDGICIAAAEFVEVGKAHLADNHKHKRKL